VSALAMLATCLAMFRPASAADSSDRFVEYSMPDGSTQTFDLATVQIIVPGRFTVIGTTIDNPDVMKLKLMTLNTLRPFCERSTGKYEHASPVDT